MLSPEGSALATRVQPGQGKGLKQGTEQGGGQRGSQESNGSALWWGKDAGPWENVSITGEGPMSVMPLPET